MTDRESLHAYLKQTLALPDYYGGNLDALFDCLTEMAQPTLFRFAHLNQLQTLGDYGLALVETFRDAAEENPILELVYLED
jgi:ribonuclease inhibitor